MTIKKHIPNLLTCGNLFCGLLGILLLLRSGNDTLQMPIILYLLLLGGLFDFLDGLVARLLKVSSPIGKELDSLADMITFGALPGFLLYKALLIAIQNNSALFQAVSPFEMLIPYLGLLITIFSALRLANFNVDTRQSDSFIGLPTPANAFFIVGIAYIFNQPDTAFSFMAHPYALVSYCFILPYLLVADIPLLALKFKVWTWKENTLRYTLIISAILLVLILNFTAIPFIIILYLILSGIAILTNGAKP